MPLCWTHKHIIQTFCQYICGFCVLQQWTIKPSSFCCPVPDPQDSIWKPHGVTAEITIHVLWHFVTIFIYHSPTKLQLVLFADISLIAHLGFISWEFMYWNDDHYMLQKILGGRGMASELMIHLTAKSIWRLVLNFWKICNDDKWFLTVNIQTTHLPI